MKSMFKKISKKFGGGSSASSDKDKDKSKPSSPISNIHFNSNNSITSISLSDHKSSLERKNSKISSTSNSNNIDIESSNSNSSQILPSSTSSTKTLSSSTSTSSDRGSFNAGQPLSSSLTSSPSMPPTSSSLSSNSSSNSNTFSSSTPNGFTKNDLLKPLSSLSDTAAPQRASALIHKLRLCCVPFEWRVGQDAGQDKDAKAKEAKRQHLLDIVEFIGKNTAIYTEAVLTDLMHLFSLNLFRALPATLVDPTAAKGEGGDDDEPVFDPSWPHLQVVYELLLRFIMTADVDVKLVKKFINGSFIQRLLELFDSEDHRERDYLKTILHRIYAKFMSLRAFIRKAINHVFFIFIYETEKHNGIAELLEILGSIINGFALPLKAEHKIFLQRVLVPLHKVRSLSNFHQQLAYCVSQFVDKDPTLAVPVLNGLLKYWPATSTAKQLLFLNELEELLELTQSNEFKIILPSLFKQLSQSITSPHFQVAERALFLWHNEYISGLIAEQRSCVLPLLYPALSHSSSAHWNPTVTTLALNVLKTFMELDAPLVEDCSRKFADKQGKLTKQQTDLQEQWKKVESTAKASPLSLSLSSLSLSATPATILTSPIQVSH